MYTENSCRLCLKDLNAKGINCLKIPEIKRDIESLFSVMFTKKDICTSICENCFENVMAFKAFNNTILQSQKLIQDYNEIKQKVLVTKSSTSIDMINFEVMVNTKYKCSTSASIEPSTSDKILIEMNNIINNELKKRQSVQGNDEIPIKHNNSINHNIRIENSENNTALQSPEIQSTSTARKQKFRKCKVVCNNFAVPTMLTSSRFSAAKARNLKRTSTLRHLRPVSTKSGQSKLRKDSPIKLNINKKKNQLSLPKLALMDKNTNGNILIGKSNRINQPSNSDNLKIATIKKRTANQQREQYSDYIHNKYLTVIPFEHIKREDDIDIKIFADPLPK